MEPEGVPRPFLSPLDELASLRCLWTRRQRAVQPAAPLAGECRRAPASYLRVRLHVPRDLGPELWGADWSMTVETEGALPSAMAVLGEVASVSLNRSLKHAGFERLTNEAAKAPRKTGELWVIDCPSRVGNKQTGWKFEAVIQVRIHRDGLDYGLQLDATRRLASSHFTRTPGSSRRFHVGRGGRSSSTFD